jgi:hypothetical protein
MPRARRHPLPWPSMGLGRQASATRAPRRAALSVFRDAIHPPPLDGTPPALLRAPASEAPLRGARARGVVRPRQRLHASRAASPLAHPNHATSRTHTPDSHDPATRRPISWRAPSFHLAGAPRACTRPHVMEAPHRSRPPPAKYAESARGGTSSSSAIPPVSGNGRPVCHTLPVLRCCCALQGVAASHARAPPLVSGYLERYRWAQLRRSPAVAVGARHVGRRARRPEVACPCTPAVLRCYHPVRGDAASRG